MTTFIRLAAPAAAMAVASVLAVTAVQAEGMPKTMIWTSYDFGSSGFAQASGIANAFQKKYGTRIRIVPSGTGIGRLLPITQRKAHYGFLATETLFASEGTYDFGTTQWGPQDIRIVLAPPANTGIGVAKTSRFRDASDIKGMKLGYVKGNPSVNVKTDAVLAFGNTNEADITKVWFGGYGIMKTALLSGKIDGFLTSPYSGISREIEASPKGLAWLEFDPKKKESWARMNKIAPMYAPASVDDGAGMEVGKPVDIISFRYPMMVTYATTSEDQVYNVVKAMHEAYDDYKGVSKAALSWHIKLASQPPADVAWHKGSIRYLKEKGFWTAENEAWNTKRLARHAKVIDAWDNALDEFNMMRAAERKKGNKIKSAEAWPKYWGDYRKKVGLD